MNKSSFLSLLTISFLILATSPIFAVTHTIPWGKLNIDGKPDDNIDDRAAKFDLSLICIGGTIKDDYFSTYLAYDENNFYFACRAKDNSVSCKDEVSRDFKDSDYIRFYIDVKGDFKDRTTLNGKGDWALIFTPQITKGKWKPMVKECPYNGPGHGGIQGDDVTPKRASGAIDGGWYVEAAIPFSLFERDLKKLEKATMGVYFIGGDTDKGGVRTGEVRLPADGAGNYWNSPAYWQPAKLGPFSVTPLEKEAIFWGEIKKF